MKNTVNLRVLTRFRRIQSLKCFIDKEKKYFDYQVERTRSNGDGDLFINEIIESSCPFFSHCIIKDKVFEFPRGTPVQWFDDDCSKIQLFLILVTLGLNGLRLELDGHSCFQSFRHASPFPVIVFNLKELKLYVPCETVVLLTGERHLISISPSASHVPSDFEVLTGLDKYYLVDLINQFSFPRLATDFFVEPIDDYTIQELKNLDDLSDSR